MTRNMRILFVIAHALVCAAAGTDAVVPFEPAVPGTVHSGVERCCFADTLYVNTGGWTGSAGQRLEKDDAGEWKGALAAILREMAAHNGMTLVFVEQAMCWNTLTVTVGFSQELALHCILRSSNETVPLAKFATLWSGLHHGTDLAFQDLYVTTSLMETDTTVLLHVRRKADYGIWQLIAPFDGQLWLCLIVACLVVSFLLPSTLREGASARPLGGGGASGLAARPKVRLEMAYHAVSMIFGGDDLEWPSNLSSRLLRMGWLFFILISVSSYTANLASFFTAQAFSIEGPQDLTALRSATVCKPDHANDDAHLQTVRTESGVGTIMDGLITANMPSDFAGLTNEEKNACCWSMSTDELISKCAEKVRLGDADAIMEDRIDLTAWLLRRSAPERCDNFTFSTISLPVGNPRQIFLALNRSYGFTFFSNLQVSLGWLRQKAPAHIMTELYQRELGFGNGCPARAQSTDTARIGVASQLGVFVIFGALVGLALLAAAFETRRAHQDRKKTSASLPKSHTQQQTSSPPGRSAPDAEDYSGEGMILTDGDLLREIYRLARGGGLAGGGGGGAFVPGTEVEHVPAAGAAHLGSRAT
jgi:hypothetical protein